MHLYSNNDASTLELGRRLARLLRPGQTIALHGDLGAGKTVLSRGIARGLGVTEAVTSPTFTIVQEYPLPDGTALYHLDMYRIDDAQAALAFGIDEIPLRPPRYHPRGMAGTNRSNPGQPRSARYRNFSSVHHLPSFNPARFSRRRALSRRFARGDCPDR